MKKIIFCFIMVIFYGCTTPGYAVKEAMLPNGHWIFGVYSNDTCDQLISADKSKAAGEDQQTFSIPLLNKKSLSNVIFPQNNAETKKECIELFKRSLANRSKELCGNDSFTLYGCLNSENESETSNLLLISSNGTQEYKLKCYLNCNNK